MLTSFRQAQGVNADRQESALYEKPQRRADGYYQPVAQALPMDNFVGGFVSPPAPPKEYIQQYIQSQQNGQTSQVSATHMSTIGSTSSSKLTQMSAVERSQAFKVVYMKPRLQLMVGPLLRYDTIDEGVWNGFALVVSK